jgi:hypothetical protein
MSAPLVPKSAGRIGETPAGQNCRDNDRVNEGTKPRCANAVTFVLTVVIIIVNFITAKITLETELRFSYGEEA